MFFWLFLLLVFLAEIDVATCCNTLAKFCTCELWGNVSRLCFPCLPAVGAIANASPSESVFWVADPGIPYVHFKPQTHLESSWDVQPYGGFHSHGGTPKWMVYKGKSHLEMDDSGVPQFMETPISSPIVVALLIIRTPLAILVGLDLPLSALRYHTSRRNHPELRQLSITVNSQSPDTLANTKIVGKMDVDPSKSSPKRDWKW